MASGGMGGNRVKETIINCYCDNCNKEMTEDQYESQSIRLNVQVSVPHPQGKAGESNGFQMRLCDECAERIGFVRIEIHKGSIHDKTRLGNKARENKKSIFQLLIDRAAKWNERNGKIT